MSMNVLARAVAMLVACGAPLAAVDAAWGGESPARAVSTLQDCPTCPTVVVIRPDAASVCTDKPAGARPTAPYAIGRTEVTFDEWDACVAEGACKAIGDRDWGRGRRPAADVTWYDAMRYTEWLSRRTGQKYRLPTEGEWEYAARGGQCTVYSFGDDPKELCRYANGSDLTGKGEGMKVYNEACADGFGIRTAPAASFQHNAYGLYDVHGNVWEWTLNRALGEIPLSEGDACMPPAMPPPPVETAKRRQVARGGSWGLGPSLLSSAARIELDACMRGYHLGFRVLRDFR